MSYILVAISFILAAYFYRQKQKEFERKEEKIEQKLEERWRKKKEDIVDEVSGAVLAKIKGRKKNQLSSQERKEVFSKAIEQVKTASEFSEEIPEFDVRVDKDANLPPKSKVENNRDFVERLATIVDFAAHFLRAWQESTEYQTPEAEITAEWEKLHGERGIEVREEYLRALEILREIQVVDSGLIHALETSLDDSGQSDLSVTNSAQTRAFCQAARTFWSQWWGAGNAENQDSIGNFVGRWGNSRIPAMQKLIEALPKELAITDGLECAFRTLKRRSPAGLEDSQDPSDVGDCVDMNFVSKYFHQLVDQLYRANGHTYEPVPLHRYERDRLLVGDPSSLRIQYGPDISENYEFIADLMESSNTADTIVRVPRVVQYSPVHDEWRGAAVYV